MLITFNTASGYYECWDVEANHKGEIWCDHVAVFFGGGKDAELWWGKDPISPLDSLLINIPLVPSENVWYVVGLFTTEFSNRYIVNWKPPGHPENAEAVFLTFFNEGEGLKVIREVLFDKLQGESGWHVAECESAGHGFKAQMEYDRLKQKVHSPEWWADRWSVYLNKLCLYCVRNQYQPDPNLVPNTEGSVW